MDNRLCYIKDLGVQHRTKVFLGGCLCIHIFWLVFFAINKITPVIPICVLSALFYALLLLVCKRPGKASIIASYFEILIFASTLTFILGKACGFYYYIFAMIVIIYMLTPHSKKLRFVCQIFGFLFFGFCDLCADSFIKYEAYRVALRPLSIGIYGINCLVIIVMIMMMTFLFEDDIGASIERVNKLANIDPLTRLSNRRGLENYANFIAGGKYCVAMLDIDNFKGVNDTFGHDAGDEVLRRIAEKLKEGIRRTDFAARWGGEEFVVCLPDCPLDSGIKMMERILVEVRAMTFENWSDLRVSFTCGITENEQRTFDEAVKFADGLLYFGKRTGKNRIVSEAVI